MLKKMLSLAMSVIALSVLVSCSRLTESLVGPSPKLGDISSPRNGETWQTLTSQNISWTGDLYTVTVKVCWTAGVNAGQCSIIGTGTTPGSLTWLVGTTPLYGPGVRVFEPGLYKLVVCNEPWAAIEAARECRTTSFTIS